MIQFPLLSIEAFYWTPGKDLCRARIDSWRPRGALDWSNMLTADEEPGQEKEQAVFEQSQQVSIQNRLPDASHEVPTELLLSPMGGSQERIWEVKGNSKFKTSTRKLVRVFLSRVHQNLNMTFTENSLYIQDGEREGGGFLPCAKQFHQIVRKVKGYQGKEK